MNALVDVVQSNPRLFLIIGMTWIFILGLYVDSLDENK